MISETSVSEESLWIFVSRTASEHVRLVFWKRSMVALHTRKTMRQHGDMPRKRNGGINYIIYSRSFWYQHTEPFRLRRFHKSPSGTMAPFSRKLIHEMSSFCAANRGTSKNAFPAGFTYRWTHHSLQSSIICLHPETFQDIISPCFFLNLFFFWKSFWFWSACGFYQVR